MRSLLRAVREFPSLLVFLDYDGTLVPIRARPDMARLHPRRRSVLTEVAQRHPTAVISGRSSSDVGALVGLPQIAYAGNHGLEIQIGPMHWVHPEAEKTTPLLGRIVEEVEFHLKSIPGTHVENKRLTASVHFRRARSGDEPEIHRILHSLVPSSPGPLKLTEGKKVIEIRPAVNWDKGRAMLFLAALMDPKAKAVPLYCGDDRTDEDAFQALAGRGLTVLAGPRRKSAARFHLSDIEAVWRFLRALILI